MRIKYAKVLPILAVGVILSLAMVLIPATPALAAPMITLSPTSGSPGTRVTVTGTNFESYRGDAVFILYDDEEVSHAIVPDDGSFIASFDVPSDAAPGTAYVTVEDEVGNPLGKSRPFTVWEAEIELYPKEGIAGNLVTIEGRGFYVGGKIVFYYNGDNLDSEITNPTSEFTYSFNIPDSVAGKHKIEVEDAVGNSDKAEFRVIPSIAINTSSGAIGDEVIVNGSGFEYKNDITLYFDKTEIATSRSDKYGGFEAIFDIPVTPSGTYDVEAEDEEGNIAQLEFTITADTNLIPTMGNVGTRLTVNGIGFMAGRTITIDYDDVQVATVTCEENGTFSVAFVVPASIGGNHTVTASDGTNVIKRIFTMESVAPPIPELILPKDADKTEAEVSFDWEDVADNSGVTYTLQVAEDADFTSLVLEQKDLTTSNYTIAGEELEPEEKETPYYWRVKAIDGASNEREWSDSRVFYVGPAAAPFTMPSGAKYALIAVAVGFLAFWLGRRTAYSKRV